MNAAYTKSHARNYLLGVLSVALAAASSLVFGATASAHVVPDEVSASPAMVCVQRGTVVGVPNGYQVRPAVEYRGEDFSMVGAVLDVRLLAEVSQGSSGYLHRAAVDLPWGSTSTVCQPAPSSAAVDSAQSLSVASTDGVSMTATAFNSAGEAISADLTAAAKGRLVVDENGIVSVSGDGFVPGSTVEVWVYSTPTLIGATTVAADGSFSGLFALPSALAYGEHTLKAVGETAQAAKTLQIPLLVVPEDVALGLAPLDPALVANLVDVSRQTISLVDPATGASTDVSALNSEDKPLPTPVVDQAKGNLVVSDEGTIPVSGDGFTPGSTVEVWLSNPEVLLGTAVVGVDGSFDAGFELPEGVTEGSNSLKIVGEGTDLDSAQIVPVVITLPVVVIDDEVATGNKDLEDGSFDDLTPFNPEAPATDDTTGNDNSDDSDDTTGNDNSDDSDDSDTNPVEYVCPTECLVLSTSLETERVVSISVTNGDYMYSLNGAPAALLQVTNGTFATQLPAGDHVVSLEHLGTYGLTGFYINDRDYWTAVLAWPNTIRALEGSFAGTTGLQSVPTSLPTDLTNATDLFAYSDFNDDSIVNWDITNLPSLGYMFQGNEVFNQDISGWDTSGIELMPSVFESATAFNQDISGWDTSNVTNMSYMFAFAESFNQDISGWCVTNIQPDSWQMNAFAVNSPLEDTALLPAWGKCGPETGETPAPASFTYNSASGELTVTSEADEVQVALNGGSFTDIVGTTVAVSAGDVVTVQVRNCIDLCSPWVSSSRTITIAPAPAAPTFSVTRTGDGTTGDLSIGFSSDNISISVDGQYVSPEQLPVAVEGLEVVTVSQRNCMLDQITATAADICSEWEYFSYEVSVADAPAAAVVTASATGFAIADQDADEMRYSYNEEDYVYEAISSYATSEASNMWVETRNCGSADLCSEWVWQAGDDYAWFVPAPAEPTLSFNDTTDAVDVSTAADEMEVSTDGVNFTATTDVSFPATAHATVTIRVRDCYDIDICSEWVYAGYTPSQATTPAPATIDVTPGSTSATLTFSASADVVTATLDGASATSPVLATAGQTLVVTTQNCGSADFCSAVETVSYTVTGSNAVTPTAAYNVDGDIVVTGADEYNFDDAAWTAVPVDGLVTDAGTVLNMRSTDTSGDVYDVAESTFIAVPTPDAVAISYLDGMGQVRLTGTADVVQYEITGGSSMVMSLISTSLPVDIFISAEQTITVYAYNQETVASGTYDSATVTSSFEVTRAAAPADATFAFNADGDIVVTTDAGEANYSWDGGATASLPVDGILSVSGTELTVVAQNCAGAVLCSGSVSTSFTAVAAAPSAATVVLNDDNMETLLVTASATEVEYNMYDAWGGASGTAVTADWTAVPADNTVLWKGQLWNSNVESVSTTTGTLIADVDIRTRNCVDPSVAASCSAWVYMGQKTFGTTSVQATGEMGTTTGHTAAKFRLHCAYDSCLRVAEITYKFEVVVTPTPLVTNNTGTYQWDYDGTSATFNGDNVFATLHGGIGDTVIGWTSTYGNVEPSGLADEATADSTLTASKVTYRVSWVVYPDSFDTWIAKSKTSSL